MLSTWHGYVISSSKDWGLVAVGAINPTLQMGKLRSKDWKWLLGSHNLKLLEEPAAESWLVDSVRKLALVGGATRAEAGKRDVYVCKCVHLIAGESGLVGRLTMEEVALERCPLRSSGSGQEGSQSPAGGIGSFRRLSEHLRATVRYWEQPWVLRWEAIVGS